MKSGYSKELWCGGGKISDKVDMKTIYLWTAMEGRRWYADMLEVMMRSREVRTEWSKVTVRVFCYGRPAHSIRLSSQGLYIDFWPSWTQNHVEYNTKVLKVSYKRTILTVRVGLQPPSLVYESRQPFCDKILRRHNIMNPHWVPRNTLTENLTQTSRVSQRWSCYLM